MLRSNPEKLLPFHVPTVTPQALPFCPQSSAVNNTTCHFPLEYWVSFLNGWSEIQRIVAPPAIGNSFASPLFSSLFVRSIINPPDTAFECRYQVCGTISLAPTGTSRININKTAASIIALIADFLIYFLS